MGISTAARSAASLILFVLIARHLGPVEFGHYMFWYGITFFCAALAGYGLSSMLLKEIAQHPDNAADILGEALSLRLILAASILLVAVLVAAQVDRPKMLLVLLLAQLIEVIAETFYVTYRAIGCYARETRLALCASIVQLLLVAAVVMLDQDAGGIAVAFLAGKIVQLVLILVISKQSIVSYSLHPIYSAFRLAVRAKAYAIDALLGNAFGNIDNIVLRICVGIDAVGVYQSGMRIFQGGAQAGPILANVFLPEIARRAMVCDEKKRQIEFILQIVFLLFGALFGLVLAYFPDSIVDLAFGKSYAQLIVLLPIFGLLFFVRFFAISWGVILTAAGYQGYRAIATAVHLVFAVVLGSYLAYNWQAMGWLIALVLASLLLGILYMFHAVRSGCGQTAKMGLGVGLIGGMFFVPKLF